MKKRILLVFVYNPSSVTHQVFHVPPLGIGYIASFLLKKGHDVKIVDLQVQPEQMIFEDLDFDLIGLSCCTLHFSYACELVRSIKKDGRFNGKIIIGGAHPTALPEDSLRQSGADLICIGEGEFNMAALMDDLPFENIVGIGCIKNGKYCQNEVAATTNPLDDYPFPAFQLYALERYGSFNIAIVPPGTKDGIIISSRGCPFSCDFCFKLNRKVRFRSPDNIISEIIYLKDRFGFKKFSIIDDCFNADPNRAKETCRRIIQKKLGITFALPNGIRADLLDEELAGLMREAGCINANIGVESWNDDVRSKMNKNLKRDTAITAVKLLQKHDIICTAYFIMGHYHDTAESLRQSIDAVKELNADFYQFSKFVPMPGSPIYERIAKEGRITEKDFSNFSNFGDVSLMEHPTLSAFEIESAIRTAYRKAALRWRTVYILIRHPVIIWNIFRNMDQISKLIKFNLSFLTKFASMFKPAQPDNFR